MTKIIYLFIGFTGIIVGIVSVIPWMALAVARQVYRRGVVRSNKLHM